MERSNFARMVSEQQARLRVFIRVLGVRPDAVDDIAQDAFVVAYQRRHLLEDLEDAGPWLRTIARNLVRNELRKSARRSRIVNAQLTESALADTRHQISENWSDQWLHALKHCVDQLPDKSRALVDGRYQQNRNSMQLAEDTGGTSTSVRQSLTRLRKSLRACVEKRLSEALS